MSTIKALYNRVQQFNAAEAAADAIAATADDLTNANRDQMLHGLNAQGNPIGYYKNEAYAEEKFKLNSLAGFGIVDLRLKDDFQRDMVTSVVGDSVITESTDTKNEKLVQQYGSSIFGTGGQYKAGYIRDFLRPAYAVQVFRGIGIKPE